MADVFQVEGWILDYACKYRMDGVIRLLSENIANELTDYRVPDVRLLCASAWSIIKKENISYFHQLINHLMVINELGVGVTTFRHFTKMIIGLKMKAMLHTISQNYDYAIAIARLNKFFPKSGIKIKCSPENKDEIIKLNQQQMYFRQFIMKLLMNDRERKTFMATKMKTEYGAEFMQSIRHLVGNYLEKIDRFLPKTAVEQFLSKDPDSSISTEATCSPSSAVKKLVKLLDSGPPSEEDLLAFMTSIIQSHTCPGTQNKNTNSTDSGDDSSQLGETDKAVPRRSQRLAGNSSLKKDDASKTSSKKGNEETSENANPSIIDMCRSPYSLKSNVNDTNQKMKICETRMDYQLEHAAQGSSMTLRNKNSDSSEYERLLAPKKYTDRVDTVFVKCLSSSNDLCSFELCDLGEESQKKQMKEGSEETNDDAVLHRPTEGEPEINSITVPEDPANTTPEDSEKSVIPNTPRDNQATRSGTAEHSTGSNADAIVNSHSGKEADVESLGRSETGSDIVTRKKRKKLRERSMLLQKSRSKDACHKGAAEEIADNTGHYYTRRTRSGLHRGRLSSTTSKSNSPHKPKEVVDTLTEDDLSTCAENDIASISRKETTNSSESEMKKTKLHEIRFEISHDHGYSRTDSLLHRDSETGQGLPWLDLIACKDKHSDDDFQHLPTTKTRASKSSFEETGSVASEQAEQGIHTDAEGTHSVEQEQELSSHGLLYKPTGCVDGSLPQAPQLQARDAFSSGESSSPVVLPHFNMCTVPMHEERYLSSGSSFELSPQQYSQDFCESRIDWLRAKAKMQPRSEKGQFTKNDSCPTRKRHKYSDATDNYHFSTASKRGLWSKNLQREEVDTDDDNNPRSELEKDLPNLQNPTIQKLFSPPLASTAEDSDGDFVVKPFTPNRSCRSSMVNIKSVNNSGVLQSSSPFRTPPESPTGLRNNLDCSEASGGLPGYLPQLPEGGLQSPLSPRLQSPKSPKKSPRCTSLLFDFYKKKAAEASTTAVNWYPAMQDSPHLDTKPQSKKLLIMPVLDVESQRSVLEGIEDMPTLLPESTYFSKEALTGIPTPDLAKQEAIMRGVRESRSPTRRQAVQAVSLTAGTDSPKSSKSSTVISSHREDSGKAIDLNSNENIKKVHFMNQLRLCQMSNKAKKHVEMVQQKNSMKRQLRETTEKKRNTWGYLGLKLVPKLHLTRIPEKVLNGSVSVKNGDGSVRVSKRSADAFKKGQTLSFFPVDTKQKHQNKKKQHSSCDDKQMPPHNIPFKDKLLQKGDPSPFPSLESNEKLQVLLTNMQSEQVTSTLTRASSSNSSTQFGQDVDYTYFMSKSTMTPTPSPDGKKLPSPELSCRNISQTGFGKQVFTDTGSPCVNVPTEVSQTVMDNLTTRREDDYSFVVPDSVTTRHSPSSAEVICESPVSCHSPEMVTKTTQSRRVASIPSMREHLEGPVSKSCVVKLHKLSAEDVTWLSTPRSNLEEKH